MKEKYVVLNEIEFKEQPLSEIKTQKEFESYFLRAVLNQKWNIVSEILDYNLVEARNTVVSVVNIAQPQKTPFIENVNHIFLSNVGIKDAINLKAREKTYMIN